GGGGAAAIPEQVAQAQVAARALDLDVARLVDLAFAVAQAQREHGRRVAARGRSIGEGAAPFALERLEGAARDLREGGARVLAAGDGADGAAQAGGAVRRVEALDEGRDLREREG